MPRSFQKYIRYFLRIVFQIRSAHCSGSEKSFQELEGVSWLTDSKPPPPSHGAPLCAPRSLVPCFCATLVLILLGEVEMSISDLSATRHPERCLKTVITSSHWNPQFTQRFFPGLGFKLLKHWLGNFCLWIGKAVELPAQAWYSKQTLIQCRKADQPRGNRIPVSSLRGGNSHTA